MIAPKKVEVRSASNLDENERWLWAKKGVLFQNSTDEEWMKIAQYPPFVKFSEYLDLKSKSTKDLIKMLPGGEAWDKNPTHSDLLFFLSRGFLPNRPNLAKELERRQNFKTIESDNIRNLLFELYSISPLDPERVKKFFAIQHFEPLEQLIYQYNRFMDDRDALFTLLVEIDVEYPGIIESGVDVFTFVYYALKGKVEDLRRSSQ